MDGTTSEVQQAEEFTNPRRNPSLWIERGPITPSALQFVAAFFESRGIKHSLGEASLMWENSEGQRWVMMICDDHPAFALDDLGYFVYE